MENGAIPLKKSLTGPENKNTSQIILREIRQTQNDRYLMSPVLGGMLVIVTQVEIATVLVKASGARDKGLLLNSCKVSVV